MHRVRRSVALWRTYMKMVDSILVHGRPTAARHGITRLVSL
jgi:hypothetical protein